MRLKIAHDHADNYSNIPHSRAPAVVENRTACVKVSDVAVQHGICVFLIGDHVKSTGALQNLVNYRLCESLLDSILEARVLKDRHRDRLDIRRQTLTFTGLLVAAHINDHRHCKSKQDRFEHRTGILALKENWDKRIRSEGWGRLESLACPRDIASCQEDFVWAGGQPN